MAQILQGMPPTKQSFTDAWLTGMVRTIARAGRLAS